MTEYVVGIDFGTLSGRAVVVRVADGAQVGTAAHPYRHGVIERCLPGRDEALPPGWALQVPEDYREVLRVAVPAAVRDSGVSPEQIVGIAVDVTATTILPVLADGTPLCELAEYADRPHAYVKLWKHHAAAEQADRINALAEARGEGWLARYGGKISAEWQFAKGLQLLEEDRLVYDSADRFIEMTDWLTWLLSGIETRNAGTAGYKGLRQDGRYPSRSFLAALNPDFADFVALLDGPVVALGSRVGGLSAQAAAWTGLPAGIAVAAGNVDAHVTAPAAQALASGQFLAIMGTSTCQVMNSEHLAEIPGMCGVVRDGITPGLWGYEGGQSGVGDILGWFVDQQTPHEYHSEAARRGISVHQHLSELSAEAPVGAHGLLALDWHNGNRSVLVDQELSGLVLGLKVSTRAPEVYRALVEATAFGARVVVESFEQAGVPITEYIVAGGLLKNPVLMQIYSDVLRRPLSVMRSELGPALGSAIQAAVAAGRYTDVYAAAEAMGGRTQAVYVPDPARADLYDELFADYRQLHDYFGRGANEVMHRLSRRRAGRQQAVEELAAP